MNKFSKFFALLKQANDNGLNLIYKEVVYDFTNQRTNSLSSLTSSELQELERRLMQMAPIPTSKGDKGGCFTPEDHYKADPIRDPMRKAIIAQFKSVGLTTKNAIHWAENHGANRVKLPFNMYDQQQLINLIRAAEKMKQQIIDTYSSKTTI